MYGCIVSDGLSCNLLSVAAAAAATIVCIVGLLSVKNILGGMDWPFHLPLGEIEAFSFCSSALI